MPTPKRRHRDAHAGPGSLFLVSPACSTRCCPGDRSWRPGAPCPSPVLPPQLVKTHELSPSHNYIIGSHPHGILCVGAFCNFVTGSTGFAEMFPGIRPSLTTLAGNFRLPLFREYLMSGGEQGQYPRAGGLLPQQGDPFAVRGPSWGPHPRSVALSSALPSPPQACAP